MTPITSALTDLPLRNISSSNFAADVTSSVDSITRPIFAKMQELLIRALILARTVCRLAIISVTVIFIICIAVALFEGSLESDEATIAKGNPVPLRQWQKLAGGSFNLSFLDRTSKKEQTILNRFLWRLENTSDYKRSPKELTTTVLRMLESLDPAKGYNSFREFFFTFVGENLEACSDRANQTLNFVYTRWRLATLSKENTSPIKKMEILVKCAKAIALRDAVEFKMRSQPNYNESTEIFLYFDCRFQEQIDAPIKNMSHSWCALFFLYTEFDFTEGEIVDIVNNKIFDTLSTLPELDEVMMEDPEYKKLHDDLPEIPTESQATEFKFAKSDLVRKRLKDWRIELNLIKPRSLVFSLTPQS